MIEFATYQLKDVVQAWYKQLRDNRQLSGGRVTLEIFKLAFIDRFFRSNMSEKKLLEFINLRQVGTSFHEYSLEYIKLSIYAPSLVFDPRDKMSLLVMGVLEDLKTK